MRSHQASRALRGTHQQSIALWPRAATEHTVGSAAQQPRHAPAQRQPNVCNSRCHVHDCQSWQSAACRNCPVRGPATCAVCEMCCVMSVTGLKMGPPDGHALTGGAAQGGAYMQCLQLLGRARHGRRRRKASAPWPTQCWPPRRCVACTILGRGRNLGATWLWPRRRRLATMAGRTQGLTPRRGHAAVPVCGRARPNPPRIAAARAILCWRRYNRRRLTCRAAL